MTVQHNVGLISQSRGDTCWAASIAMLVNYRDGSSWSDLDVANSYPHQGQGALPDDWANLAPHYNLTMHGGQCLGPSDWESKIAHGPAIVIIPGKPYHAVVVSGARSDGTVEGSEIYVEDPGRGEQWWPYDSFVQTYEAASDNPVNLVTL